MEDKTEDGGSGCDYGLLACGLGGGLDILNASILYFAYRAFKSGSCSLGSCRATERKHFTNHLEAITQQLTWINEETIISGGGGRHVEPLISKAIKEKVLYISRGQPCNKEGLKEAVIAASRMFETLIFVDGGGDSLILQKHKRRDPFKGGDAEMLAALRGIPNAYLAIIAAGVDIPYDVFLSNMDTLRNRGGYYGSVNMITGERKDYRLEEEEEEGMLLPVPPPTTTEEGGGEYLNEYFKMAEDILVLHESDKGNKDKMKSNMATITYHALKGNYGPQRTWMEPDGKPIEVTEEHRWMHFFSPTVIEDVKVELAATTTKRRGRK